VNVVGGVRIDEPGADLAVALAVASAARGVATNPSPLACFGEIGLTGELRSVAHPERRAAEAAKFGLRTVLSPVGAPTLRAAVRGALGDRDRPARAA
jgi:DNA repair protein RadA/Sms